MKWLTKIKKRTIGLTLCGVLISTSMALAAPTAASTDLDTLIQNQKQVLEQLNDKKTQQYQQDLNTHIDSMEKQLSDLKKQYGNYDAQGAITSLSAQINALQEQLNQQVEAQNKILLEVKSLKSQDTQAVQNPADGSDYYGTAATKNYLVNPGPSPSVGYTQDAINAQGDSTMVFSYSPAQLYKIYSKVGFITDLQFKKGEKVTYVGGGDTAKWIIDSTDVDGTPHLYIKPINSQSTTNIVVNTTKHSYQILANSSDWYNPMVRWSYGIEEEKINQIQQKKDEQIYTDKLSISRPEDLSFRYEIKGNAKWKPIMAFTDGQKTYIQFNRMSKSLPILFIKEANRKELSLVNYKVKDKYYIIDKVFEEAQLRLSDNEVVTITAKSE
jgi:type IV secretion system protein VirB9